jgi:hypothetical protein
MIYIYIYVANSKGKNKVSLDVYLSEDLVIYKPVDIIYIRENGQTREISREEWDSSFPGIEPVVVSKTETNEIFDSNITHNLAPMSGEAGLYTCLWRPDEVGITKASELIEPLQKGLELLKSDPDRFKKFNPENGWGTYEVLISFVSVYLQACQSHPEAKVSVSR